MTFFVAGRTGALILVIIMALIGMWSLEAAKKGKKIIIRHLPGMTGIDEAVKRCVEMGRPVFFTTDHGGGGLYTVQGPAHIAGISILYYLARRTARLGVDLITVHCHPEIVPLAEQTIREAYTMEGRIDEVHDGMALFFPQQMGIGYLGELTRQNAGAAFLTGAIWSSTAIQLGETAVQIGAMQIGGVVDIGSVSMLAMICDYLFIGEELYAAGALASEDPIQLGVTLASDIIKVGLIILMFAGLLISSMGINIFSILGM